MKSGMRDLEADLKLTIFSSCLRITVLCCPPRSEETLGVVAVIGIGGVRRRVQRRGSIRYNIRGLAGPRKRIKTVIQDEPIDKLEDFITMSRRC